MFEIGILKVKSWGQIESVRVLWVSTTDGSRSEQDLRPLAVVRPRVNQPSQWLSMTKGLFCGFWIGAVLLRYVLLILEAFLGPLLPNHGKTTKPLRIYSQRALIWLLNHGNCPTCLWDTFQTKFGDFLGPLWPEGPKWPSRCISMSKKAFMWLCHENWPTSLWAFASLCWPPLAQG